MIKIILGLGNPGKEYAKTRHNLGFLVLDTLAQKYGIAVSRKSLKSVWGEGLVLSKKIILIKPLTFMNLSGFAAAFNLQRFKAKPEEILVVCDDLNLEPGVLRVRKGGSSGGHNGLASVIEQLGSKDFPRLRIGIGRPVHINTDPADFVLDKLSKTEWKFYNETAEKSVEVLETIIAEGVDSAMNKYN